MHRDIFSRFRRRAPLPTEIPTDTGEKADPSRPQTLCHRRCCCLPVFWWCIIAVVTVLLLVAAALLIFFLLARTPKVEITGIAPPSNGQPRFAVEDSTLYFNFDLIINVDNPNYIGAHIDRVDSVGYWPDLPDVPLGNGTLSDFDIEKRADTVLYFPVGIRYNLAEDPERKVLTGLADKCGFTGGPRKQLTVHYDVNVHFRVLSIAHVSPSFGGDASFDCPIPSIQDLQQLGVDLLGSLFRII
ncbi:hypothetical protein IWQ60_002759 [Tieghemiomyces parasiticus]|uniref:Late embryogenesis abundant protein LEA-2 subgroup domain-containing protein n=1 Tax=Tieghemiomyces parasiticus TaxID=78921 RepID=A0A9W8AHH1_9FUNG|nr:hypothetical protein IWQ60_002759 [Tieghemiomyces parasiticus]